eukprot:12414069-Karenia_brevis.AAC.1
MERHLFENLGLTLKDDSLQIMPCAFEPHQCENPSFEQVELGSHVSHDGSVSNDLQAAADKVQTAHFKQIGHK